MESIEAKIERLITITIAGHGTFVSLPDTSKIVTFHGIRCAPEGGLPTAIEGSMRWHSDDAVMVFGLPDVDGHLGYPEEVPAGDCYKPIDYGKLRTNIARAIVGSDPLRRAVLGE